MSVKCEVNIRAKKKNHNEIPILCKSARLFARNRLDFPCTCAGELKEKKRKIPLHNIVAAWFGCCVANTKACLL